MGTLTAAELQGRLLRLGPEGSDALGELVHLAMEHTLSRPVTELVDADWVAEQIVAALSSASASEETEGWLKERIADLRERVPDERLSGHAPDEVMVPLRQVVARPVVMERDLAHRLIDHSAVERLLGDVISGSLEGFVSRLKPLLTAAPKVPFGGRSGLGTGLGGRLGALGKGMKGLGEEVLGGLSAEFEHKAKDRIGDFVRSSMSAMLGQVADHLCDPDNAEILGEYRVHILDTLLETPLPELALEIDKLDPDDLVATGAAVARSLAGREGFQAEVAAVIRAGLDETGGRSLRDFLQETGLEEGWRDSVEAQLGEQAREFVKSPEFTGWLEGVLAD